LLAGLDCATTSGLALWNEGKIVRAESYRADGANDAEVFTDFRRWLIGILKVNGVVAMAVEEPLRSDIRRRNLDGTDTALTNMRTYLRLYGLRGHAIQVCHAAGVKCVEVNQSTWRKSFTGNGHASKDDTLALARHLVPGLKSKDAAEAVGIVWHLAGEMRMQGKTRGAA
jgi:hypothetical protein